jgi:1-acyl-sn-glycerol-3-phosphate acyltransferase
VFGKLRGADSTIIPLLSSGRQYEHLFSSTLTAIHAPLASKALSDPGVKRGLIYAYRYFLVLVFTVFWGTIGTVLGLIDRSGNGAIWVARNWVSWTLRGCGIRVVVKGLENVDLGRPHIFMCNHQSVVDVAALIQTIPLQFRFVAKRELARIPFFGWALALGGHVLIDRGNRPRAIRSLERASRQIRGGTNVIVFPEGTRSKTGELQTFKKGGFHLAIAAQVPVVPVTVSGSQRITPKHSLRIESGEVKIRYGKPILTTGMSSGDRHTLADEVRAAITIGYDPAYQDNSA